MPGSFLPGWMKDTVDFIASWFFIAAVSSFLLSKTFDQAVKLVHISPEEKKEKAAEKAEEDRLKAAVHKIINRF